MSRPDIPKGWNTSPVRCRFCGEALEAGAGPLRRQKAHHGPAKNRAKGYYFVEHPGCLGILPWRLHKDGWIYACTGVGPDATFIKVGATSNNPIERVTELLRVSSQDYFRSPMNRRETITIWGVYEHVNRYTAERQVHHALQAYRVPPELELGREIFAAPLPLVLKVMEQVVGGEVQQFLWSSLGG